MKKILVIAAALPIVALWSCHRMDSPLPEKGGAVYLDLPAATHRYFDTFGQSTDSINQQATLGRVLFYDRHLSINNSVSCGSCHKQTFAFSDNSAKSAGFANRLTGRNTPALQNLGFSGFGGFIGIGNGFKSGGSLFWDGRESNLQTLITRPISNHVEMGISDLSSLEEKLRVLPYYKELFKSAYGTEEISVERISRAVSIFVNALISRNTRFDQNQSGKSSLSAQEQEGFNLFNIKYNCAGCHNVQVNGYFSGGSGQFVSIGLDMSPTDKGLGVITQSSTDDGKFRVPNLRNVALTAPYMHDGRFKTLDDVLEHYSHNIQANANLDQRLRNPATQAPMRMNISSHEKESIIAFLGTLSDPDLITNPAFADPFKTR